MTTPLAELVTSLMITLHALGGYSVQTMQPDVTFVPREELARLACSGNCSVQGAYLPERGVLLVEGLDPLTDERARAVLLHELVHHAQHLTGRHGDTIPCERYFLREREAYGIENRYLARLGRPPNHGFVYMLQSWSIAHCPSLLEGSSSSP